MVVIRHKKQAAKSAVVRRCVIRIHRLPAFGSTVIQLYSIILKTKNHQIISKIDGTEGWNEFQRDPPDLLILDLNIPGIDGRTILKEITSNQESH